MITYDNEQLIDENKFKNFTKVDTILKPEIKLWLKNRFNDIEINNETVK